MNPLKSFMSFFRPSETAVRKSTKTGQATGKATVSTGVKSTDLGSMTGRAVSKLPDQSSGAMKKFSNWMSHIFHKMTASTKEGTRTFNENTNVSNERPRQKSRGATRVAARAISRGSAQTNLSVQQSPAATGKTIVGVSQATGQSSRESSDSIKDSARGSTAGTKASPEVMSQATADSAGSMAEVSKESIKSTGESLHESTAGTKASPGVMSQATADSVKGSRDSFNDSSKATGESGAATGQSSLDSMTATRDSPGATTETVSDVTHGTTSAITATKDSTVEALSETRQSLTDSGLSVGNSVLGTKDSTVVGSRQSFEDDGRGIASSGTVSLAIAGGVGSQKTLGEIDKILNSETLGKIQPEILGLIEAHQQNKLESLEKYLEKYKELCTVLNSIRALKGSIDVKMLKIRQIILTAQGSKRGNIGLEAARQKLVSQVENYLKSPP